LTRSSREEVVLAHIDRVRQRADWAWKHKRWRDAAEAYDEAAKRLVREVLSTSGMVEGSEGVLVPRRWHLLSGQGDLASRAVFAHAKDGDPRKGILSVERLADVVGATELQCRMVERLRAEGYDELWRRYTGAMTSLRAVLADGPATADGRPSKAEEAAREKAATVAEEIRQLPGFARFAVHARWSDVEGAAAITPLVYIATTNLGTVVIVLVGGSSVVRVEFAEAVTASALHAHAQPFFELEVEGRTSATGDPFEETHNALHELVEWLSDNLFRKVRVLLGDARYAAFVTPGLLSLLPIPAAVVAAEESLAGDAAPLSPVGMTIVPSARSYFTASEDAARPTGPRALVVRNPRPINPLFGPLELGSGVEQLVRRRAPETSVLAERKATVDAVLASLPGANLVVFWCHGALDRRLGYSGVLLLADNRVFTVLNLAGLPELTARLVVLGACRSGMPVIQNGGEVITLSAAFLGAGASAVLSTLWRVDEIPTLLVISRFLEEFETSGDTIEALRSAQAWLRRVRVFEIRERLTDIGLDICQFDSLKRAAETDVPYGEYWYWAPFHLVGA
jgi:hypothetical protein